jgi:hypothetical protein
LIGRARASEGVHDRDMTLGIRSSPIERLLKTTARSGRSSSSPVGSRPTGGDDVWKH